MLQPIDCAVVKSLFAFADIGLSMPSHSHIESSKYSIHSKVFRTWSTGVLTMCNTHPTDRLTTQLIEKSILGKW